MASQDEIKQILKKINTKKSAGPGTLLPGLVKSSVDIIDKPLTDSINHAITECIFPNLGKIADVTPIYKKKIRTDKVNYRPVSVIGSFSKILERYIQDKIYGHIESCLSDCISTYRKKYSSNQQLIKLIETWKSQLDQKYFVGAVLMDLSKAFDCVPHDLLIAKMHAYGFDSDSLIFFYSYLKNRKQSVKINNIYSSLMVMFYTGANTV